LKNYSKSFKKLNHLKKFNLKKCGGKEFSHVNYLNNHHELEMAKFKKQTFIQLFIENNNFFNSLLL